MPQWCSTCKGSGQVPTAREARLAMMSKEDADLIELGWNRVTSLGEKLWFLKDGTVFMPPERDTIDGPPRSEGNDIFAWYLGKLIRDGKVKV